MKEFVCIVCPKGCNLTYRDDGSVTGNSCKRGISYAVSEATDPVRFVTSTVKCRQGGRCPVRTSKPISKNKMTAVMREIRNIRIDIPVETGTVIIKNVSDSGADLISTTSVR